MGRTSRRRGQARPDDTMEESTEKRKKYIPEFHTRLFYAWCLALVVAPVCLQAALYASICLVCGSCFPGPLPWIAIALVLVPVVALMHWTLKKLIKAETDDLRAAIRQEKPFPLTEEGIRNFYDFPVKVLWLSLPLAVVVLLPVSFYSRQYLSGAAFAALFLVPLASHLLLFAVFSVAGSRAIAKMGQFIPKKSAPSKAEGNLGRSLLVRTSLILGGFALALCALAALAAGDAPGKAGVVRLSALSGAAVTASLVAGAWWLGKTMGGDFRKISSYFNALFNIDGDKTISGIKVIVPSRLPIAEVRELWMLTKDVMGRISEMRRLQREAIDGMLQNQKIKTLFLASMSHDLKSPLNSIIGFSELLLKGIEGELNEEQREDIQLIHDSGEELLSIINNVLDYARLEAGTLEIHKEWTPSVELVTGVAKTGSNLIGGKSITIQTEIQPGLPPVFVDPVRISQVLYSLISNAIKFMDKGSITLKVHMHKGLFEENDKYLKIDVIDTGMGISQEDLNRIFDSFKQVDSSFARRSSGLGLGLSLSKALIELHNGKIWVKSEEGEGSVFSVGIPMEPIS